MNDFNHAPIHSIHTTPYDQLGFVDFYVSNFSRRTQILNIRCKRWHAKSFTVGRKRAAGKLGVVATNPDKTEVTLSQYYSV